MILKCLKVYTILALYHHQTVLHQVFIYCTSPSKNIRYCELSWWRQNAQKNNIKKKKMKENIEKLFKNVCFVHSRCMNVPQSATLQEIQLVFF